MSLVAGHVQIRSKIDILKWLQMFSAIFHWFSVILLSIENHPCKQNLKSLDGPLKSFHFLFGSEIQVTWQNWMKIFSQTLQTCLNPNSAKITRWAIQTQVNLLTRWAIQAQVNLLTRWAIQARVNLLTRWAIQAQVNHTFISCSLPCNVYMINLF